VDPGQGGKGAEEMKPQFIGLYAAIVTVTIVLLLPRLQRMDKRILWPLLATGVAALVTVVTLALLD
jgi:predicted branched-subunit amino acid permease